MIDLSLLRSVRIDPDRRRAWVAGGALLGDLIGPPSRLGWPPRPATSPTPACGPHPRRRMGWLARQHGLACDNVARFQVVTADGELLHASEQEHPELYWGCAAAAGTSRGDRVRVHPTRWIGGAAG